MCPAVNEGYWDPVVLEAPGKGVEIREGEQDRWTESTARQGKVRRDGQLEVCKDNCGSCGGREDDWAAHIFREHNKEADAWSEKERRVRGKSGRLGEEVTWSDVTGIGGFWDGSCRTTGCGAGMWISVFTPALGWLTVHQKK